MILIKPKHAESRERKTTVKISMYRHIRIMEFVCLHESTYFKDYPFEKKEQRESTETGLKTDY